MPRLTGRVVVVAADAADAARSLARDGAAVVVIGAADTAGRVAADIERAGGRAAAFVGDLDVEPDRVALAEMVDELFAPGRP